MAASSSVNVPSPKRTSTVPVNNTVFTNYKDELNDAFNNLFLLLVITRFFCCLMFAIITPPKILTALLYHDFYFLASNKV